LKSSFLLAIGIMSPPPETEFHWDPLRLLQPKEGSKAPAGSLIILNQPLPHIDLLRTLWDNTSYQVAADGGANQLLKARQTDASTTWIDNLAEIIGDLDSLSSEARAYFNTPPRQAKIHHDADQYSTDFGKAIMRCRECRPCLDIVAIGGLGGRVDQGLSQLHHLYLYQKSDDYADGKLYLVSNEGITFVLKKGTHEIIVRHPGAHEVFDKYVGILPVGGKSVITTQGLEWDVMDWETEFGGQVSTSNHILPDTNTVTVRTTTDVLFTIALKAGSWT
jgi:thiamine pyrophosphokinase